MTDLHDLMALVRQRGCRITQQREVVLRALCELDGHASAERVHEQVMHHRPDVDLSTVYRTLERFRDLLIVSQTDLGRGFAEYEIITKQPHHHLICLRCGRVIDVDHAYLAAAAEAIHQDFDFDPILSHFAIFGLCRVCRGAETRCGT